MHAAPRLNDAMTRAEDIEEAPAHLAPLAARAYLEARTQGLCHEGALEIAAGVQGAATPDMPRLETVEFKIAHLERAVQELSDVIYRQQQQLDATLAMNQRLREQLEELEGRAGEATPSEVPPHY
jgi:SlyX protein